MFTKKLEMSNEAISNLNDSGFQKVSYKKRSRKLKPTQLLINQNTQSVYPNFDKDTFVRYSFCVYRIYSKSNFLFLGEFLMLN